MSNFWAKFYEPLPSAPLKPNNASAIFGGQSPYGLRAAEPSIFRPKDPAPNKQTKARKRVSRSNSDVGISKSEKRKSREIAVKRKVSESSRNGENNKNNRPVSPRIEDKDNSSGDSPDGENGDRYPLFISVKKPADTKTRKSNNEGHCNGSPGRKSSETSLKSKKVSKDSDSPFSYLRREKTDFIIRPKKNAGETSNPTTALKREKSDFAAAKQTHPSAVKSRNTGSPSPIRREKTEITLKRSQPPTLSREKSDLVKPRGTSASPGPLRREKSDITTKRTPPPVKPRPSVSPGRLRREKSDLTSTRSRSSSINKDKTDVIKPRGSTSPGSSLKREKSDVTKKPNLPPSKSGLPKPRVSASSLSSPDPSPSNTLNKEKPSLPTSNEITLDCNSEPCKHQHEVINERAESPSQKSSEPFPKKTSHWPSKSGLPKPRVYASTVPVKSDKDLEKTCASPEPLEHKEQPTSESPKSELKQPSISFRESSSNNSNSNRSSKENSDILTNRSSGGEICDPLKTSRRVSSPDSGLESNCDSIISTTSQPDTLCLESDQSEMSKIPTPTSTQVSRIPSLTKASTPTSKLPPKSKIPSFSQKVEEDTKPSTTGIPTISDRPASKIPGLQRADPAKENKDPALNGDSVGEVNKHNSKLSRIPSVTKTTPQGSQIPSLTGSNESPGTHAADISETPKSRIPSISSAQSPNASTPVSKIPSFGSKHSLAKTPSKEEPDSKIPHLAPLTTPKPSGIPKPETPTGIPKPESTPTGIPKPESAPTGIPKPESAPTGIPKPESTPTGIHKPESTPTVILKPDVKGTSTTESRIPQFNSQSPKLSGIPKPEVSVSNTPRLESASSPTESKIPTFSTPRSKIPAPSGSVLARKDSEEKIKSQRIAENQQNEETGQSETKESPSTAKVPPPPPPRQDVSPKADSKTDLNLSMDEEFFTDEAKLMEELLRNESILVEVPEIKDASTKEMTSKSEAVSNQVTSVQVDGTSAKKELVLKETKTEQFLFQSFGKKEDQISESSPKSLSLGLTNDNKNNSIEGTSPQENKSDEAPTIDTLGQYEQQSRRSRSRQRKIISPDSEEASQTFEQTTTHESVVTTIEKDMTTTSEETESTLKVSKTKVKHDKPKFVIESSIGADFYQSKSSQSKDSIADEAKAKDVVVIQNKAFDDTKGIPKNDVPNTYKTEEPANKNSAAFDDPEVSSNRESKVEMKAWSMEDLDEKTVKCYSCSRGGKKCTIM